jgi:RimJ/RimL family protein N-acetyltransferase
MIPTLHTERLILRAPKLADFEHWAAHFASPRSIHEGGPLDSVDAYRHWACDVGLWTLRGYGPFGVDDRDTGAYQGEVGIYQSAEYPGPELGWFVVPAAEGKGIAAEAARAVMAWVRASFGWTTISNIIEPANARSIALGLSLGGRIDPAAPGIDPGDVVIVHDLEACA